MGKQDASECRKAAKILRSLSFLPRGGTRNCCVWHNQRPSWATSLYVLEKATTGPARKICKLPLHLLPSAC